MSECMNDDVREMLPAYIRGDGTNADRARVTAHIADCAECRAEVELLRAAHAMLAAAPSIDTGRVAARVIAASRPGARSAEVRSITSAPSWRSPRRALLAAASIAVIAAASLLTLRSPAPDEVATVPVDRPVAPDTAVVTPEMPPSHAPRVVPTPSRSEIVFGGGIGDLNDAEVEALLAELEQADVLIGAEPVSVMPWLEGDV